MGSGKLGTPLASMKLPFRIKICGVRTEGDIRAVASGGGDAVGLNFYPKSVRYVEPEVAKELNDAARGIGVLGIGLFVNESFEAIIKVVERSGLTTVQLHGDESEELASRLMSAGVGVLRAVRLPVGPIEVGCIEAAVRPWEEAGCGILLDADAGAAFGGAGQRLDWDSILAWVRWRSVELGQTPEFVLAGGLKLDSVVEAIRRSGAWAVDVASGVERVRGAKDAGLVTDFCVSARSALQHRRTLSQD